MALDDMFLKIEGSRQGPINGGSVDVKHKDEIDILSWSWGMQGNANAFQTGTSRTTLDELVVSKKVDGASTGLMSAIRNNESIKRATLTVRKAGGTEPVEYLRIVLEQARITSLKLHSGGAGDGPAISEQVGIGFQKIRVEYQPQGSSGGSRGASTFEADVGSNT
ncbi:type VI secretion system tube protein Hcp [Niveibacterium sp. SC-1]|uniref:Hcp family type VI secretion system effector n=1 Tax=Niveibacterium sp. SC-1 TaxID=3135646 RepID=UPI00311E16BB